MRKEFIEEADEIIKDVLDMGVFFKLMPNGDTIIAQIQHNNCAAAVTGNEMFIKRMLSAFTYSVISGDTEFDEQPQDVKEPDNVIDMSTIASRKFKRN